MKTTRKYELNEHQAELVHTLISTHCATLKNWTATAVENNDLTLAQKLVKELREYERLFALTNVEAHRFIDAHASGNT